MSRSANPVSKHADPLDLQLDHVAALQPAALTVLEDAARAHGARAEHVAGTEVRVPRRVRDDCFPGVVHVGELAARALLTVHTSEHRPARAVELVRSDDDRP